MPAEHLFVYGTLRRGCDNQFAQLLSEQGRFVGTARVPGLLYDFGSYPGARRSNQAGETILGEIFYLEEPATVLAILDDYEGTEFEREIVTTTGTADCWIYWYVGAAEGRRIASGDWLKR